MSLTDSQIRQTVEAACPGEFYHGKRVLLIVPDGTRTAPIGRLFKLLHERVAHVSEALDVLIALGTHQPMNEIAICQRLELAQQERSGAYKRVRFFNHTWAKPPTLKQVGTLTAREVKELTNGLFSMEVPVQVNRLLFDYDQVIIIGPVFPHEVVGFSGGNKYLFPGVGGPQILNFFHWLGAVVTNPKIIGNKWTPVRKVVDLAGGMVKVTKLCFCLVVDPDKQLLGLFAGTPEAAWDQAAELSRQIHIVYKPH